jgi:hypothetical protein
MCTIEEELNLLLQHGNLGYYSHCEIVQIVLLSKTNIINYYTNIDFSSEYRDESPFTFLTEKLVPVTKDYKLAISRFTIPVNQFLTLYCSAAENGIWKYNGDIIIDDAFITNKKFIPNSDPTGGQYNIFVPLEYGLYGSTIMGNYYVHELFSKKTVLHEILNDSIIRKIYVESKKCGINCRLDKLKDRIGNVVCKFAVETLKSRPRLLGDYGIELDFLLDVRKQQHRYCLHIFQEYDGLLYENRVDDDFDCSSVHISPNQSKTTISIIDVSTSLTLFWGCYDYSRFSNYYSQITPPAMVIQSPEYRVLHFDDHDEIVEMKNIQMIGSVYTFIEMEMSVKRKLQLDDEWFCKKGYLKTYIQNEHENAIRDIVNIINENLIWDLQELWIIDPYLCADDLILTALRCAKKGIIIKALCAYSTIHGNSATKEAMDAIEFETFKKIQHDKLEIVLGEETDLRLEYRSVRNGHGVLFHDRYIMLKYALNKDRVWSLGASINSIGKHHSIIQIVEAPDVILSLFDKLWNQTGSEECLLFCNKSETMP